MSDLPKGWEDLIDAATSSTEHSDEDDSHQAHTAALQQQLYSESWDKSVPESLASDVHEEQNLGEHDSISGR